MLAKDIITENIPPLKSSDTGEKAIDWMMEFKLSHLPLVDNRCTSDWCLKKTYSTSTIPPKKLGAYLKNLYKPYVKASEHIFEVLRVAAGLNSPVIPVVDEEMHYLV